MDISRWFELIRPVNALMAGVGVAVGYFLTLRTYPLTGVLGLSMLSAMLISAAGMAINDYFDRHIDARIKPHRPIPSGRIKSRSALLISLLLFGIGVYIPLEYVNITCVYIALIVSLLLVIYSWLLAKLPLLGNIAVALSTGLTFVFGEATATGHIFSTNISILFTLAFLSTLAREIYKDIEDVEGDKISRRTIPMIVGREISEIVASSAILISVIASPIPYILGTLNIVYILGIVVADVIFTYIAFASLLKHRVYSKELKIAQLIALFSFLLGM